MTPELESKLVRKYPKIFKVDDTNSVLQVWGIECDDGWYDLLDCLCSAIQNHIDFASKDTRLTDEERDNLQLVAQQVKSKYGGLRFYSYGGDVYTEGMIGMAEKMSYRLCEFCGFKANQQTLGTWIYTACNPCYESRVWRKTSDEKS